MLFALDTIAGSDLLELLARLCSEYKRLFGKNVASVLSTRDYLVGLTYGVDVGTLLKFVMNQRTEYIGRPLNVASRLQDAIRQRDRAPNGKLLISNNAFAELGLSTSSARFPTSRVERELRNISGGERFQARKIVVSR